ncbi:MAG TPA: hypothetical protein VMZ28_30980 [Kofleriaceae bacterium]|nr:hypothetical protein [Kofleriaceae bacterium]
MSVDGGDDNNGQTRVTGTVWAPGNGPGQVVQGFEIPVSGAMVLLSSGPGDPIPQEATCIECTEAPPGAVITDAKGNFEMNHQPGTYWLIIQKAQFRLEQQIVVTGNAMPLPGEMTTLPSSHDPTAGKWIPHIALATGYGGDPMEDILGKIGIGQTDPSGTFIPTSAAGKFDLYQNSRAMAGAPQVSTLVQDLEKMMQYHIIFFPCDAGGQASLLMDDAVRRNIRDYVAAGGRLYVADWAGDWADAIFPAELTLKGDGTDTPAAAYDREADTWNTELFGDANGSGPYDSTSSAADPAMAEWLDGQMTPNGPIAADAFNVTGNWNRIDGTNPVDLGIEDAEGNPVVDEPKTYVQGTGDSFDGDDGVKPLMATYEPAGCGRVMYSTFHTSSSAHVGLLPQERVLVYLLLELGVCKEDPGVD